MYVITDDQVRLELSRAEMETLGAIVEINHNLAPTYFVSRDDVYKVERTIQKARQEACKH